MACRVLVPVESKTFFEKENSADFTPVYYQVLHESFVEKVLRKLGRLNAAQAMASRFQLIGREESLNSVYSLWLSSSLYLPTSQMSCLLEQIPELKWVYSQATGTDYLDLNMFERHGVMVSNSGRLSSRRVAEMALANICAHAKRLVAHIALQRTRKWRSIRCDDLLGQTVGIIGTGNIGRELACLCRGIGMRVIGASRDPTKFGNATDPFQIVVRLDRELETLLEQADFVVLALPLNEQTCGCIGEKELKRMKPTASLINVARGKLVQEDALCDALARREIASAFIDVPSKLPPYFWSGLYRAPNLVLTHYSAANNVRIVEEAFQSFVNGVRKTMETGQPPNRIV